MSSNGSLAICTGFYRRGIYLFLLHAGCMLSSLRAVCECVLQPLCVIFFPAESLKSDMSLVVNVRVLITRVCLLTRVSNVMRQCVSL